MSNTLRFLFVLLPFLLLLSLCGKFIIHSFWPQYECAAYWIVPSFFTVFYIASFLIFFNKPVKNSDFTKKYFTFKGIKFIVTLTTLFTSVFLFRNEAKMLVVTFFVFYILTMLLETAYIKKGVVNL